MTNREYQTALSRRKKEIWAYYLFFFSGSVLCFASWDWNFTIQTFKNLLSL